MKRALAAILLCVLVAVVIVLVFFVTQNGNQAAMSGSLTSDTTWSGTITLSSNMTVCSGVQLTILPGTIINYNSTVLHINGTLIAKGNKNQSITLIGQPQGKIIFSASSTPWNEQSGSGCIIDYSNTIGCTIESLGASPKITNCILNASEQNSHVIVIDGGAPIITFNTINGVMRSPRNGYEGGIILQTDNNAIITNNTVQNCTIGIGLSAFLQSFNGTMTIQSNLIIGNTFGVYLGSPQKVDLEYNTITLNRQGVRVAGFSNQSIFSYNTIYGNTEFALSLEDGWWPTSMYVPNNWWGTTDTSVIGQSIVDSHDDSHLGTVDFRPVLQDENPNAPKP
jgi:hypothetical protein